MGQQLILRPSAAGSSGQSNVGAGGDRVSAVSEATADGDTSYVYAAAGAGAKFDFFTPDGNGLPPHCEINGIAVYITAKQSGLGTGSTAQAAIKVGGTPSSGSSHALTGSYVEYNQGYPINPISLSAWTKYDIDNLEIGYVIQAGSGSTEARLTQCYVLIDYEPASDALFFGP